MVILVPPGNFSPLHIFCSLEYDYVKLHLPSFEKFFRLMSPTYLSQHKKSAENNTTPLCTSHVNTALPFMIPSVPMGTFGIWGA